MHLTVEIRGFKAACTFWQSLRDQADRQARAAGMVAASFLTKELRRVAPRRTGTGARSIAARPATGQRIAGGWVWRFFSRFYMLFTVPPGTRAHPIEAKRAQALRFFWQKGPRGPGIYFFKRVQHPGYKPPFDWRKVAVVRTQRSLGRLMKGSQVMAVLR